jgi:plastocyanin
MKTIEKSPSRLTRFRAGSAALVSAVALALAFTAGATGPASSAQAAGSSTVDIHNFAFHPGTLHVSKGSKVVFSNSSGVAHTATRTGVFDTGRIKPGTSVSVRFNQKGTFAYHCEIHNFMHGKIVVG